MNRYFNHRVSAMIDRVLAADTDNFVELVVAAGLRPDSDFRDTLLRSVDFHGCDLTEFDFSGTTFDTCRFAGSRWGKAGLADASFRHCDPTLAEDWDLRPERLVTGSNKSWNRLTLTHAGRDLVLKREPSPMSGDADFSTLDWLLDTQRHPILILGAPGSGKTMVMASLVEQMRAALEPEMEVSVPATFDKMSHWTGARFDPDLAEGTSLKEHVLVRPPVMGIDLRSRASDLTIKLALLEGTQQVLLGGHARFTNVFEDVLPHFPRGLSIMFLIPWRDPSRGSLGAAVSEDAALAGMIESYRDARPVNLQAMDRHVIVLNRPISPQFVEKGGINYPIGDMPSGKSTKRIFKDLFPEAWALYCKTCHGTGKILDYLPIHAETLDHLTWSPRQLISWMAGNAIKEYRAPRSARQVLAAALESSDMTSIGSLPAPRKK